METTPWLGNTSRRVGADYAANYVSWDDATTFCRKLSQRDGRTYRLPTEAEWEYACRAGAQTMYGFGDDDKRLGEYGWYDENALNVDQKYAHRVAQKKPNAWELYDMHGNLYEWCQDWFAEDYYRESPSQDPRGPSSGSSRVLRGGSWDHDAQFARSAYRSRDGPIFDTAFSGFRVVCEME